MSGLDYKKLEHGIDPDGMFWTQSTEVDGIDDFLLVTYILTRGSSQGYID